jgi:hypothetical protein
VLKRKIKESLGLDLREYNEGLLWSETRRMDRELHNLITGMNSLLQDHKRVSDLVEWLHEWVNCNGHKHTKRKKKK